MNIFKKIIAFSRFRIKRLKNSIQISSYKKEGISLPPTFTIGKGTEFIIAPDSKVLIEDGFKFGDYSLLKLFEPNSYVSFGKSFSARRGCIFQLFSGKLIIGDYVAFNNNCSISCFGKIEIGEKTMFGENVKMYDHNHKYESRPTGLYTYPNDFTIGEIKIGKNCWIGSNVVILNNVTIGDNSIIGAGCVIYKSVPPNSIVKNKQELIITDLTVKNE